MFTITVQHISYEVHLQCSLLYHPLAVGEVNLPDSKLVLFENGRVTSDFSLTHYKRSDDSQLHDEQQLLYLTLVYQPQRSGCFLHSLDCVQLLVDQDVSGDVDEVDYVTAEKFFDLAFVDQETVLIHS
ncbi:hypothetical protein TNCV_1549091 [Trichonephila clavipes]|nr:hypothetical protein TNCV_1549091 [Trichonephila clavipes]